MVVFKNMLIGVLAVCAGAAPLTADEPRYNGQPMSFWVDCLQDADARVRTGAAYALAEIAAPAAPALPALRLALRDPESRVRAAAIHALGNIGAPGVPALREALSDRDPVLQTAAIEALGSLGAASKEAVPDLIAMLNHESPSFDPERFVRAAQALGRVGPAAGAAVPHFRRVLLLDNRTLLRQPRSTPGAADRLRKEAAAALAQIHDPDGSGRLIALLSNSTLVSWRERPAADGRKVDACQRLLKTVDQAITQPNVDEPTMTAALRSVSRALQRTPRDQKLAEVLLQVEQSIESVRTKARQAVKPATPEVKEPPPELKSTPAEIQPPPANALLDAADEALVAIDVYRSSLLDLVWELCGPADSQTRAVKTLAAISSKRTRPVIQDVLWKAMSEITDIPTLERIIDGIGVPKTAPKPKPA